MQLLDIRVIMSRGKNPCNDPALVGHAQALIDAKAFDWAGICRGIDSMFHSCGPHAGWGSFRMFGINRSHDNGSDCDKQSCEVHDCHAQYEPAEDDWVGP